MHRRHAYLLTALVALIMLGSALGLAPAQAQDGSPAGAVSGFVYRLGGGDKLRVTVFNEADLSGEFELDGTGTASLPLVGQVRLDGLTVTEAEEAIRKQVRAYVKEPRVSVEVLNYRPFYILGEVNTPGSYRYVNGMSVLNAVAMGGGFSYRADKGDVRITRKSGTASNKFKGDLQSPVMPGDVIEIGERFF